MEQQADDPTPSSQSCDMPNHPPIKPATQDRTLTSDPSNLLKFVIPEAVTDLYPVIRSPVPSLSPRKCTQIYAWLYKATFPGSNSL